MAQAKTQTTSLSTSMDILGARLHQIINSPSAQRDRTAVLRRAPEEAESDWDVIIEALTETEGVHVTFLGDEGVRVCWDLPERA